MFTGSRHQFSACRLEPRYPMLPSAQSGLNSVALACGAWLHGITRSDVRLVR